MKYNQIYNHKNVFGDNPNHLLMKIDNKIKKGFYFLDLGCGQGRDSLFMLQKGCMVDAVDISSKGIADLEKTARINGLPIENLHLFCVDIKNFDIIYDKYDVVNIFNSLQFLLKEDALLLLNNLKSSLKIGSYVIISGFTTKDSSYKNSLNKDNCFFKSGELRDIFSGFNIFEYEEKLLDDIGHPGNISPHVHGVVYLLAQK